jgi:hypothetical protein
MHRACLVRTFESSDATCSPDTTPDSSQFSIFARYSHQQPRHFDNGADHDGDQNSTSLRIDRPQQDACIPPRFTFRSWSSEASLPYKHVHLAKRTNRTVHDAARALMFDQKIKASFWQEAVSTSVYVKNRLIDTRNSVLTPYQRFFDTPHHAKRVHLSYLR